MPRILVVGSANIDVTVAVARLPAPGETVSNGTLLVAHGGKGANQAVAARRLGAEVRFIGRVGDDASGHAVRVALAAEGIGVEGLSATGEAATGTALIVVDGRGRNQIAVAPGANRRLGIDAVATRAEDFAWAEVVVCQFETPLDTVRRALETARRHGATTILNPAPVPDEPVEFLSLADYLTPNETEAARLSGVAADGESGARTAAATLAARGAGTVVVTLGEAGALAHHPGGTVRVPAYRVEVVDTTGAGDAFNGALAVALAERHPLPAGLAFATATAALACTRRGAQPSFPARREVDRLLRG